ncbi:hypothetical protein SAMN04487944_10813 [Gracilibacillus ureilyticus]|uniref:Uncharacterized protein n=1 Tax=Gracilibacillus ureilyticus TaxID=531814 RepID=A0A1H9R400_9BACI|nr:hypothetical protein [Gracilibacillus ureilyticus]SER67452.1 hypothetical protein SAMN04487944_10813 [Gracilibacillus ureilyticus]
MEFNELIKNINNATEQSDLATARRYIEENLSILKKEKHLLNHNAREILEFIVKREESGNQSLNKKEMATIRAVNIYSENFDIRGVKMIAKEMPELFQEREALNLLTADSVVLLKSIGVLKEESVVS